MKVRSGNGMITGKVGYEPVMNPSKIGWRNITKEEAFLLLLAVRTGLEPATPCVTGMYSNQLNYRTNLYVLLPFRKRVQRYCFFLK